VGRPPKKRPGPVATALGSTWNTACPDWQDRIRERRSLLPALPLNAKEADDAVRMFGMLRLPDVPGTPRLAQACGQWFLDAVRALFGAYDPETGIRHINEVFILLPKKQSKTTYGAALMLTAMFMSRRPRAEFLFVAPTQEIADLAYKQAVGMIELDPVLQANCHIQEHIKRISRRDTGAFLKIKSFDPRVVTGSKPAGVLLDETHVIAEAHDADRVIGQLRGGLISQPEGFIVQITTQGERPPSGVFLAELRKARAVRDGTLVAPILPLLYEFPPKMDWENPENWPLVMPNLGRSVTLDRLINEFRAAKSAGQEETIRWASQHLNIEVGVAIHGDAWAGALYWDRQATEGLTLDDVLQRSEIVEVGIDGGGMDDMLGLAVLGRERGTGRWLLWTHCWVHRIAFERRKVEAPRLADFVADGTLTVIEDSAARDDARQVADLVVMQVDATGLLDRVGVDAVGIADIRDELVARGFEAERIVAIPQGWRLAGAILTTERRLADGSMQHGGQRMMQWCVGNAKIEVRGNAVLVTKQAAGRAKIDPLCATFDAAALLCDNPDLGGSVYDAIGRDQARLAAAPPAAVEVTAA
jgi:phage terminase large subunit-like protein